MRTREMFVYILASRTRKLYVGVTNDLGRRLWEHEHGPGFSFTKRYGITRLVHFEPVLSPETAIRREKQIKGWVRVKKLALIEAYNPNWDDLGRKLGFTCTPPDPSLRSG
ncbi:MAG: GIY-YIG nuclease family protein [Gemmatimonadota bacterium]|nr:GIY-YIG nuclease family protein [Gemmatimonadota bacterium]